jgi:hypothetical protein
MSNPLFHYMIWIHPSLSCFHNYYKTTTIVSCVGVMCGTSSVPCLLLLALLLYTCWQERTTAENMLRVPRGRSIPFLKCLYIKPRKYRVDVSHHLLSKHLLNLLTCWIQLCWIEPKSQIKYEIGKHLHRSAASRWPRLAGFCQTMYIYYSTMANFWLGINQKPFILQILTPMNDTNAHTPRAAAASTSWTTTDGS